MTKDMQVVSGVTNDVQVRHELALLEVADRDKANFGDAERLDAMRKTLEHIVPAKVYEGRRILERYGVNLGS
jgi:hypothetical protein